MSLIQSLLLAFIQGITEFLPVSSSGHLNLFQHYFGLTPSLTLDIFLNTATLLSVLFFFRNQFKLFFSSLPQIVLASTPVILVGFFFENTVASIFSNIWLLPLFFLINSIILFSTKKHNGKKSEITTKQAIVIGLSQIFAILPGVSRSGTTIATAMALGIKPIKAFNFSFFLYIFISLGAVVMGIDDFDLPSYFTLQYLLVFVLTFFIGIFALKLLQKFLKQRQIWYFALYTLLLSLILSFTL